MVSQTKNVKIKMIDSFSKVNNMTVKNKYSFIQHQRSGQSLKKNQQDYLLNMKDDQFM